MARPAVPSSLRELRHQRGLSLAAVGVLVGSDPATISRLERGLTKPTPTATVTLARALGIDAQRMAAMLDNPTPAAEPEPEAHDAA